MLGSCVAAPGHKGKPADNFDGTRFINSTPMEQGAFDMVKLATGMLTQSARWPAWVEIEQQTVPDIDSGVAVTFINHSSFLVQIDGVNILTDPIFSERASPFTWAGPKRIHQPGIAIEDLPQIDVILISHNHYDHLDEYSLKAIAAQQETQPLILAGLGNGLFFDELGLTNHTDLNWNQSHQHGGLTYTFTECRHRSGRGLGDQMKTLWGSFVIETAHGNIYFAGDTGYDEHFVKAGEKFEEFALSLLPIGAYEPRWFMAKVHMNPEEAVQAHLDLNSQLSVGIHYGTFQLTYEGVNQPLTDLKLALEDKQVEDTDFWTMDIGETRIVR